MQRSWSILNSLLIATRSCVGMTGCDYHAITLGAAFSRPKSAIRFAMRAAPRALPQQREI